MKVYYVFESTDDELLSNLRRLLMEQLKYEIMWTLRSLEQEMTQEGGVIMIFSEDGKSGFETLQFTPALTERITVLLKTIKPKEFF